MNFADLIQPHDRQTFLRNFWEKQLLHVTDRHADLYSGLFSIADVDHVLSTPSLHSSTIRVIRDGRSLSFDRIGLRGTIGDHAAVEAVIAEHRSGATIALNALNRTFPSLRDLCQMLGQQFSAAFQVNAYLTPPNSQGFGTHHDTHDVFILQIAGTKHWHVFEATDKLPLSDRGTSLRGGQASSPFGVPLLDVDLRPGDLMYLPRGFPHHALSAEATSLHLTVGAHTVTWATVIQAALEVCIEQDVRFRASLPPGFAANDSARNAAAHELGELVQVFADSVDTPAALDDAAEAVLRSQRAVLSGRLLDIEAEPRVLSGTRVRRRPEVQCAMSVDADRIRLRFSGKVVTVPRFAVDEIRHLLDAEECTVNELPGTVDDQGRLVLVRRLIREGLLTICR